MSEFYLNLSHEESMSLVEAKLRYYSIDFRMNILQFNNELLEKDYMGIPVSSCCNDEEIRKACGKKFFLDMNKYDLYRYKGLSYGEAIYCFYIAREICQDSENFHKNYTKKRFLKMKEFELKAKYSTLKANDLKDKILKHGEEPRRLKRQRVVQLSKLEADELWEEKNLL